MTDKERIQELMKPRVLIIAPWPGMNHNLYVGAILMQVSKTYRLLNDRGITLHILDLSEVEKCTANFRPLEWYEFRKPEDMPAFVKFSDCNIYKARFDLETSSLYFMYLDHEPIPYSVGKNVLPATETEYTEYINQQKQKV